MVTVVRTVEKPLRFIKVDKNDNLILVDTIEECSVFDGSFTNTDSDYLRIARETIKSNQFIISEVPSWLIKDISKQLITHYSDSYLKYMD